MEAQETQRPESGDPGAGCGGIPRPSAYPIRPGGTSEIRPVPEQIESAMRDLAEFGWVTVPSRKMADRLYRLATAAGQRARIRKATGRGWWRVEIEDMRSRDSAREG